MSQTVSEPEQPVVAEMVCRSLRRAGRRVSGIDTVSVIGHHVHASSAW